MVNVLIVDDDNKRTREITAEISLESVVVDVAITKKDAMRKMGAIQYDLVILDIMLPDDLKTVILSEDAGVDLLCQIENVRSIKKPRNILGVTSGPEVYKKVKPIFDAKLIPLFSWDNTDIVWKEQLKNKIEYLVKIDKQTNNLPVVDIGIITAVESEYNAVKALFKDWENLVVPNDPSIYQITSIKINESVKTIVLTMLPEMGMTSSACLTTKILQTFSPNQIYMIGICGGIKGEVELGDIIVASTSWDYGSGKIKPRSPQSTNSTYYELEPSPNQISIYPTISSEITTYKDTIISEIVKEWNELHPEKNISPQLHLSPMPSGASVICDEKVFSDIIRPQHRKCIGLDMETYGVYFSVKNVSEKQIDFVSIKCVSDYANIEKNDDYHEVCCYTSANFLLKFIKIHNSKDS